MVRTTTFAELPDDVREAISSHGAPVTGFLSAAVGNHAEVAGELRTSQGRVFIKGTRLLDEPWGGGEAWSLRNEAAVNPYVQPYAPELLWQVEAGGWLILGFEYVTGRHADYSPGSADLDAVANVVVSLGALDCPPAVRLLVEQRYTALSPDAAVLAGDRLLHCDLNPANVLISASRVRVVDWAFTSRGSAWLEYGFMIPWLMRDGHTPMQAEMWMDQFTTWKQAEPAHIDLFARLLSQQWARRNDDDAEPWVREYAHLVQRWAVHRA